MKQSLMRLARIGGLEQRSVRAEFVFIMGGEVGEDVSVFVEIPYGPGWGGAVAAVEADGLLGMIRADRGEAGLPRRLLCLRAPLRSSR